MADHLTWTSVFQVVGATAVGCFLARLFWQIAHKVHPPREDHR